MDGEILDKYIRQTGQTMQYIYSGAAQYGPGLIDHLVQECVRDNKKIKWSDAPLIDGEDHGFQDYELVLLPRPVNK